MHRKRTTSITDLTLLIGLLLTACGGTTDQTIAPVETTAATATSDSTANTDNSQSEAELVEEETDAAGDEEAATADGADEIVRPDGWSDETHGKSAEPNYAVVFPDDEVNTMTITIAPGDWQAMLEDMTATYGEPGSGGGPGDPGQGEDGARPPRPDPGDPRADLVDRAKQESDLVVRVRADLFRAISLLRTRFGWPQRSNLRVMSGPMWVSDSRATHR